MLSKRHELGRSNKVSWVEERQKNIKHLFTWSIPLYLLRKFLKSNGEVSIISFESVHSADVVECNSLLDTPVLFNDVYRICSVLLTATIQFFTLFVCKANGVVNSSMVNTLWMNVHLARSHCAFNRALAEHENELVRHSWWNIQPLRHQTRFEK